MTREWDMDRDKEIVTKRDKYKQTDRKSERQRKIEIKKKVGKRETLYVCERESERESVCV